MRVVRGVGINDLGHSKNHEGKPCVIYKKWSGILERCFDEKWKSKYPTYRDVICCDEWLYFSKFKSWVLTQPYQNNELDKDLLFDNNKIYSPHTCLFIPQQINKVLAFDKKRGLYLQGVSYQQKSWSMKNDLKRPWLSKGHFKGSEKPVYFGNFSTESDAHVEWLRRKAENLEYWAERWRIDKNMSYSFSEMAYSALYERSSRIRERILCM